MNQIAWIFVELKMQSSSSYRLDSTIIS